MVNDLDLMAFQEDLNNCKSKLNEIHTLNSLLEEKSRNASNKLNLRKVQLVNEIKKLN